MKIIYGINKIKRERKAVVALGVFDGVHRGHSKILKSVVRQARKIKGTSVVLTFWPHPQKEESLYSLNHRLRLFKDLGIDTCIVVDFNSRFALMSAEAFIINVLIDKIGSGYIYIGRDFRFGRDAQGDAGLLSKFARSNKFKVKSFAIIQVNQKPISSTIIRRLIKKGNLAVSEKLLGRRVSVLGSVIKGTGLGRRLGFPTANINPEHEVIPPVGIYAVKIIVCGKNYNGICYIGSRPTIDEKNKAIQIEVHIFNFHKNIYGKLLEIKFIKLIRLDKKFASLEDLSIQIQKDIILCRKILKLPAKHHNS
jgi:riboflavin kinase / FMN adenylyltransferase